MTAVELRAALEALGWTHADAARELGVAHRQQIGRWVTGVRKVPTYIAAHVRRALDTPPVTGDTPRG